MAGRLGLAVAVPPAPAAALSLEPGLARVSTLYRRRLVVLEIEAADCPVAYALL